VERNIVKPRLAYAVCFGKAIAFRCALHVTEAPRGFGGRRERETVTLVPVSTAALEPSSVMPGDWRSAVTAPVSDANNAPQANTELLVFTCGHSFTALQMKETVLPGEIRACGLHLNGADNRDLWLYV